MLPLSTQFSRSAFRLTHRLLSSSSRHQVRSNLSTNSAPSLSSQILLTPQQEQSVLFKTNQRTVANQSQNSWLSQCSTYLQFFLKSEQPSPISSSSSTSQTVTQSSTALTPKSSMSLSTLLALTALLIGSHTISLESNDFSDDERKLSDDEKAQIDEIVAALSQDDSSKFDEYLKIVEESLKSGFHMSLFDLKIALIARLKSREELFEVLEAERNNVSFSSQHRSYACHIHATLLLSTGALEEAESLILDGIGQFPKAYTLRILATSLYFSKSEFSAAYAQIENLLLPNVPRNVQVSAHILKSEGLRSQGNPTAALEEINKAIEVDETNPKIWIQRGKFYLSDKRLGDAVEDFDKSISLKPTADGYLNRALASVAQISIAQIDDSLKATMIQKGPFKDIQAAMELNPSKPEQQLMINYIAGKGFFILGDYDQSAFFHQKALSVRFRPQICFEFVQALLAGGKAEAALNTVQTVIDAHNNPKSSIELPQNILETFSTLLTSIQSFISQQNGPQLKIDPSSGQLV